MELRYYTPEMHVRNPPGFCFFFGGDVDDESLLVIASQPTPPGHVPPPPSNNEGLIAGLMKGNPMVHKPLIRLGGGTWPERWVECRWIRRLAHPSYPPEIFLRQS